AELSQNRSRAVSYWAELSQAELSRGPRGPKPRAASRVLPTVTRDKCRWEKPASTTECGVENKSTAE
ncbi:hypothetical protein LSAT2_017488, partial [Lamellibrachia satsuma]